MRNPVLSLSSFGCAVLLFSACGSEVVPPARILPVNVGGNDQTSSGPINYSPRVFANLDFQPSGVKVKVNTQFKVSGDGQVTVGQVGATNVGTPSQMIQKHLVGIAGGAGGTFSNGVYSPSTNPFGPMKTECGVKAEETLQNLKSDGTTVDVSAASYATWGPCCGAISRGIQNPYSTTSADLFAGKYRFFIEKFSCAPAAPIASLIMKIVPPNVALNEVAPILVGENYKTTPYVSNTAGEIYFAANDIWRQDNEGSWLLTVTVLNP